MLSSWHDDDSSANLAVNCACHPPPRRNRRRDRRRRARGLCHGYRSRRHVATTAQVGLLRLLVRRIRCRAVLHFLAAVVSIARMMDVGGVMRTNRTIDPKTADAAMASKTFDALFRLSQQFIRKACQHKVPAQFAHANFGELLASATNLALAIEIALKALLLKHGVLANMSHELDKLFEQLPHSEQEEIERAYLLGRDGYGQSETASFFVEVLGGHIADGRLTPNLGDNSLRAVLSRASAAFVSWRYFFDHGSIEPGGTKAKAYEFRMLGFVAEALRTRLAI